MLGGTGTGTGSGLCSITQTCPPTAKLMSVSLYDCIGTCSCGTDYVKCTGPTRTLTKWCDGTQSEGTVD